MSHTATVFSQAFFHGTKADLGIGEIIEVGFTSNFLEDTALSWVYFTATLDTAIWGAELSKGEGHERIYVVETTGPYENDPNVTDKKFPGNPTMSYRSRAPLRIIAEATNWQGHAPDQVRAMKEGIETLRARGGDMIID